MSKGTTITREQYLQHRAEAGRDSRRKIILPGILLVVPMLALTTVFGKARPPINLPELILFWSLAAVGIVGLAWCYVRMFQDMKSHSLFCPCCGKNIGSFKAERWLIASGRCIKCGGKVFQDSPDTISADSAPLVPQTDYESRLKKAEAALLWQSFFVSIPLLVTYTWIGRQAMSPTGSESYHAAIFFSVSILCLAIIMFLVERTIRQFGIKCPKCGSAPLRKGAAKIVLSTGGCVSCGHSIFAIQSSNGGSPK
jgi:predicted  nucleic acid-binding Zn-ribbon protein